MQSKFGGGLLIALAILAGLAITLAALHWLLPDAGRFKDLAGIVQSVVTVLAIIIGGIIAAYKLQLFRDFEPHLTISHAINHRRIRDGYVHLDVTATLQNSSRVKVELREGGFLLQQIAPVLGGNDLLGRNIPYPLWPILDEASFDFGGYEITLEPGQSLQETLQFIVPDDVETVLIHYYFSSSRSLTGSSRVWGITDVYDTMI